jgi:hypothetical protein
MTAHLQPFDNPVPDHITDPPTVARAYLLGKKVLENRALNRDATKITSTFARKFRENRQKRGIMVSLKATMLKLVTDKIFSQLEALLRVLSAVQAVSRQSFTLTAMEVNT